MDENRQQFLFALGQKIKRLREEREWSQEYLAERCGYTSETRRSSINKLELGKSDIPASKLKILAGVFGISPAELMDCSAEVQKQVNACELFEECYGKETFDAVKMFMQLDPTDRARIAERMQTMLEADKYSVKKELKNA